MHLIQSNTLIDRFLEGKSTDYPSRNEAFGMTGFNAAPMYAMAAGRALGGIGDIAKAYWGGSRRAYSDGRRGRESLTEMVRREVGNIRTVRAAGVKRRGIMKKRRARNRRGAMGSGRGGMASLPKELKIVDAIMRPDVTADMNTTDITTNMANNQYIWLLNGYGAGTAANQRIGRRTITHGVVMKGVVHVIYNSAVLDINMFSRILRFVIVHDKQPSNTLPIKSVIFHSLNRLDGKKSNWLSHINSAEEQRFDILYDKCYTLVPQAGRTIVDSTGLVSSQDVILPININLPMTVYSTFADNSADVDIGKINSGAIYLIAMTGLEAQVGGGTTQGKLHIDASIRTTFSD